MTDIDYDLNIFRKEVEVEDLELAETPEGTVWVYTDPWFIDVYVFEDGCQEPHLDSDGVPLSIELTAEEAKKLALGSGYFEEDDVFIGLEGFLRDYEHQISSRLWDIFNGLPSSSPSIETSI